VSARRSVAHVVCFGNAWHGDDGFGQHVFRCLQANGVLPPGVMAFDAGTAGLNALGYFDGCAKAVMVDAVRTGARVGTVHRLLPGDLAPPGAEFSLHELGVSTLLAALATSRRPPDVVLIGAEVAGVHTFTQQLSAPLEAAVAAATRLVLLECRPRTAGTGRKVPSRAPETGYIDR
jgi:hydrogenase maturation protease